jgi:serine/threonine protein kinase
MELGPGTKVTPNVELDRLLGEGGMGSVWVAKHLTLDTEVAVKFVIEDKGDSKMRLSRFKREASIAAKLTSPHVVRTFDHGVMDNDKPFIVMELLSGETLTERLRRDQALSLHNVFTLMTQLAGVLNNAHAAGIVHRDLKPDNLFLIDSEYELFLKVLDFGIAKQTQVTDTSMVTESGALVGTPNYMSPELLLGHELDHRADLWAASVLAYQCFTGALPFEGDTVAALSVAICHDPFTKPSELAPNLPAELDDWFQTALEKDPDDRFSSARELVRALEEAMGGWGDRPSSGNALRASKPSRTQSSDDELEQAATQIVGSKETPTFGGSTSTLDDGRRRARRWGGIAAAGLLAVGAIWLATSDNDGDDPQAGNERIATASALTPTAEPGPEVTASAAVANAAPTTRASASATTDANSSVPKPAHTNKTRAMGKRSLPVPKTPKSTSKPTSKTGGKPDYCATHGFTVTKEGHKVPKPECL